jgi:hypothetical protein
MYGEVDPTYAPWPWLIVIVFVPAIGGLFGLVIMLLKRIGGMYERRQRDDKEVYMLLVQVNDLVKRLFENPSNRELMDELRSIRRGSHELH